MVAGLLRRIMNAISKIFIGIFGTKEKKNMSEFIPYIKQINKEWNDLKSLTNDQLREKTNSLKCLLKDEMKGYEEKIKEVEKELNEGIQLDNKRIAKIKKNLFEYKKRKNDNLKNKLMEVLPEAFAIMKETTRRFSENSSIKVTATLFDKECATDSDYVMIDGDQAIWKNKWSVLGNETTWNMIYFDEQLLGGIALHQGKIAEMATGEGKTLVSTLPIFLNALTGKGVHMVTVNDYLAKRDCAWMKPLLEFHGLSVKCIDETKPNSEERRLAYAADVVYGTNNEFGFDYLRDNMVTDISEVVQRGHYYAIIDEVDSILIDDARTPLIMSGPVEDDNVQNYVNLQPYVKDLYDMQNKIVNNFLVDAKQKLKENINDESGRLELYRSYRGLPKYKPLIRYLSEPGIKIILEKTEDIYIENNNKRMPEVDEELLFAIEERWNDVQLTDKGLKILSDKCGDKDFFVLPDISKILYDIDNNSALTIEKKNEQKRKIFNEFVLKSKRIHTVKQLLKAYALFENEIDYVVINGQVLIVDEQTGRILDGRRYSDGLHQALEAKEMVTVRQTTQTYATITLQNYFRLYEKLAGMTGTAETEAVEFYDIYKLDVISIPTHKKVIREDKEDLIYKTAKAKFSAIVEEIVKISKSGRPVLVGTTSIEVSEMLSRMLLLRKIKHQVLNAKYHQKEAEIISHAGESGTVTIATNMAGRGTDIKLDDKSKELGGLAIIGTERHDSRRVDRQLRGRAGRQGDPGSSQFFVSYEDNLMRMTLGNTAAYKLLDKMTAEDEVLQGGMITRSIERAQRKVEENNYGYRKRLLEYDDVINKQRSIIYRRRRVYLENKAIYEKTNIPLENKMATYSQTSLLERVANNIVFTSATTNDIDYNKLKYDFKNITGVDIDKSKIDEEENNKKFVANIVFEQLQIVYNDKIRDIESLVVDEVNNSENNYVSISTGLAQISVKIPDDMYDAIINKNECTFANSIGRYVISQTGNDVMINLIDKYWTRHLMQTNDLKQAIQNLYYEQKDPLLEFKFVSFEIFFDMLDKINIEFAKSLFGCKLIKSNNPDDLSDVYKIEHSHSDILEQMRKKMKVLIN